MTPRNPSSSFNSKLTDQQKRKLDKQLKDAAKALTSPESPPATRKKKKSS